MKLADLGLSRVANRRWLFSRVGQAAVYIGITMLLVGALVSAVLGGPGESSAISQQPKTFWFFLLDITLITWLLIGFGEELVFRGFILDRLLILSGTSRSGVNLACLLQAIWFGAGHASQGISGMLITGAIGFVLAWVFLNRMNRNLWPLVIAHASIDTVILTLNWISVQM